MAGLRQDSYEGTGTRALVLQARPPGRLDNTRHPTVQATQDRTMGRSDGHPWGEPMAASGDFQWPPMGRFPWRPSPPQPDALMPFFVTGAIREGRIMGNHFSLVRRRGDETAITGPEAVHGLIVAGRAALAIAATTSR